MLAGELKRHFLEIYGGVTDSGVRVFFAPGKVNLMGEHTEYNGGRTFQLAMSLGIYAAVRLRTDRTVRIYSDNRRKEGIYSFPVEGTQEIREEKSWKQLIECVFGTFREKGITLPCGADILYSSYIPMGAGLAASASLTVVTAFALRAMCGLSDLKDFALEDIAQEVGEKYWGLPVSWMDSFISMHGKRGHGIFMASQGRRHEYIPLHLENNALLITDSGVRIKDFEDIIKTRIIECEKALTKLKVVTNIENLCDLTMETFNSCKDVIMDEDRTKRARHIVSENIRTIRAVSAMRVGNLNRIGELMRESHISMRDEYEISCPELDFLVGKAWEMPEVTGSCMTGGGFGGCTVTIVRRDAVNTFKRVLTEAYQKEFGVDPDYYLVSAESGAREVTDSHRLA
ncbi:MAG: galactokinase [Lachnospiraceae bacterium]|nr:galactokinase [Lachnospiraceae bacterium]